MQKVTVDLEWEAVDSIIKQQLLENYEDLSRDLELRKKDEGFAIFDINPEEDVKEISRHLDALKTVLSYYGHHEC